MNSFEAQALALEIGTDLGLDAAAMHQLRQAARQLGALSDDAAVQAKAREFAERYRTCPMLAGAALVVATGITTERFASSLGPAERARYEASLSGTAPDDDEDESPSYQHRSGSMFGDGPTSEDGDE